MKKIGIMAAVITVNFVLQTSLYNFVGILGVVPNVSLILVVIFAMMTNGAAGGFFGILTGVLFDTMLHNVFGVYTLVYFIIGAIIGAFSEELNRDNYLLYTTATLLSTIFMNLSIFVILFFLKYRMENTYLILGKLFLEIILNTFISVFILRLVLYIFNRLKI